MGRRAKIAGVVVLIGMAGVVATVLARTLRYGFSARDEPTALEAYAARTMRRLAVPADLRDRKNPVPLIPEILSESKAHFADHCASCHGNDGKGTDVGRSFYPKVPDMTLPETQSQSDGALFASIENGIRLTGMPAWGDGSAESAYGSWTLVHFIRHLPKLTEAERAEMRALNPKGPEEWRQQEEERRFLAGGETETVPPSKPAPQKH